jgi:hypothetical protein
MPPVTVPRGIRNHNPGNIRRSTDKWRGLAPEQTDAEFFQFISPTYGIRAMAIILLKYQRIHGRRTIASIIDRWAPPAGDRNGNLPGGEYTQNSNAYAKAVAKAAGVQPHDPINLSDVGVLYLVLAAMMKHENGQQPYGRDIILQAINMAGVR